MKHDMILQWVQPSVIEIGAWPPGFRGHLPQIRATGLICLHRGIAGNVTKQNRAIWKQWKLWSNVTGLGINTYTTAPEVIFPYRLTLKNIPSMPSAICRDMSIYSGPLRMPCIMFLCNLKNCSISQISTEYYKHKRIYKYFTLKSTANSLQTSRCSLMQSMGDSFCTV